VDQGAQPGAAAGAIETTLLTVSCPNPRSCSAVGYYLNELLCGRRGLVQQHWEQRDPRGALERHELEHRGEPELVEWL
jgi:hypothetical protein